MIFEVLREIVELKDIVSKIELNAMDKKVHELSFIEKSAASALGRQIKSPPKLELFRFVKLLQGFIISCFWIVSRPICSQGSFTNHYMNFYWF